ncbi:hypothetical protein PINS_up000553 [Pythium insidiosum]|nr:hypothetical protein PINS_up000553 [Pythium insidiosum]
MPPSRASTGRSGGVLGTLRRLLLRRRDPPRVVVRPERPEGSSSTSPAIAVATASNAEQAPLSSPPTRVNDKLSEEVHKNHEATAHPLPPREPSEGDEDDDYEDVSEEETEDGTREMAAEQATAAHTSKKKKKKKTKKKEKTQWVAKLLNQVGVTKDRVHRRKKKKQSPPEDAASRRVCHPLHLAPTTALHLRLLGRVFAFLSPSEPAKRCATVNTTWSIGVRQFYDRAIGGAPRPRAFLSQFVFDARHHANGILARVFEHLSLPDRVRASAACVSFSKVASELPLELHGDHAARLFLHAHGARRIKQRFHECSTLGLSTWSHCCRCW